MNLWRLLLNKAFKFIDFDERIGIEKLYEYLSDFRDFEEILYGANPFYRDHTYHCINLYLMGEYLFRDNKMYNRLRMFTPRSVNRIDAESAIFCIISLTHDIGYPIEILNSINQNISKMYSHYKNIKLNELSFEFPLVYQGIFEYLIDILSITPDPKKSNNLDYERESEEKYGKPIGYIELKKAPEIMQHLKPQISKALIDYNHGLFSCFKLIENLHLFKDNYGISFSNLNLVKKKGRFLIDERFLISQLILKTIHYHSTTDVRICEEDLMHLWFNLLDDISEWSRYTKAEGYSNVPGFCKIDVKHFSLEKIEIHFIYENYFKDSNNNYSKSSKPCAKYRELVKKYYQIINPNIKTKIKFIILDESNHINYIFERTKGVFKPKLEIPKFNISSDEIFDLIMKKNGLEEQLKKANPP